MSESSSLEVSVLLVVFHVSSRAANVTTTDILSLPLSCAHMPAGVKIPAVENLGVLLDGYDAIDFTDNEIAKLENFPLMKRLRSLYMANNRISRVEEGLGAALPYLQTLVLTGNRVASLAEVNALSSLSSLLNLSLLQNPVTRKPNYRWYVVWKFPELRVLDFQRVTLKERTASAKFFGSKAGKAYAKEVVETRRAAAAATGVAGGGGAGGGGNSSSTAAGAAAAKPAGQQPAFTDIEIAAIHAAIAAASSVQEMNRLERFLQEGKCPPELMAGGGKPQEEVAAAAAATEDGVAGRSNGVEEAVAASVPAAAAGGADGVMPLPAEEQPAAEALAAVPVDGVVLAVAEEAIEVEGGTAGAPSDRGDGGSDTAAASV